MRGWRRLENREGCKADLHKMADAVREGRTVDRRVGLMDHLPRHRMTTMVPHLPRRRVMATVRRRHPRRRRIER